MEKRVQIEENVQNKINKNVNFGKFYLDYKVKVQSQHSSCSGKNMIGTPFPSYSKEFSNESGIEHSNLTVSPKKNKTKFNTPFLRYDQTNSYENSIVSSENGFEENSYMSVLSDPSKATSKSLFYNEKSTSREVNNNFVTPDAEFQKPPTPPNIKLLYETVLRTAPDHSLSAAEVKYIFDYTEDYIKYAQSKDINLNLMFGTEDIGLQEDQWRVVVKYILGVHAHYQHSTSVFYQTIKILYAFLQKKKIELPDVQSVATACALISIKYNCNFHEIPQPKNLVKILYENGMERDVKKLLQAEKVILETLEFDIKFVDVLSVVSHFLINQNLEKSLVNYYIAGYMIDVSLFDKRSCNALTMHLAAAAVIIGTFMTENKSLRSVIKQVLEHYNLDNISDTQLIKVWLMRMMELAQKSLDSNINNREHHPVHEKYSYDRYENVTPIIEAKLLLASTEVKRFCTV